MTALMLVLGHAATATLMARCLDSKADWRGVVFFALLADLVDKPLGLVLFRDTLNNGRVFFHSLVVNLALTAVLALWRAPVAYSLALWLHQLCDRMWCRPSAALWPFLGAFGYRELSLDQWVSNVLGPYNLITESLGFVYFVLAVFRHRLYETGRLRYWLSNGVAPPASGSLADRGASPALDAAGE